MSTNIDQALITEFSAMVHQAAQQKESKLRPYVKVKQMSGDVFAYDGLGRVEAREVVGRFSPATFDDITHNRRKMRRNRFVINLPVDSSDVRGALLDLDSEYAEACAAGLMRQYDHVIYGAAFADVQTGRDFETTVTAANDGVLTVDATSGLTYEKMLEITQNFINNEVDVNKMFLTITGDEHTDLMGEAELTSGDFTRQFAIEGGTMKNAAGYDLITFAAGVTRPIIPAVSSVRALIAGTEGSICLGVSKEMSIKIVERDDHIETHQVQVVAEIGAVRTEGALLQKVNVTA